MGKMGNAIKIGALALAVGLSPILYGCQDGGKSGQNNSQSLPYSLANVQGRTTFQNLERPDGLSYNPGDLSSAEFQKYLLSSNISGALISGPRFAYPPTTPLTMATPPSIIK